MVRNVVHCRRKLCRHDCLELDWQPSHKLPAEANLASLTMDVRLQDAKQLFVPQGSYWLKGQMSFKDLHGHDFEGAIRLAMLF
jgi:hypothetical protein